MKMKLIKIAPVFLLLTACAEDTAPKAKAVAIVRICRDGTHIFRYTDGSIRSAPFGYPVDNLETVCEK